MDNIVEIFLLEKLKKEIKGAREAEKELSWLNSGSCKLVSLESQWQELENLIKDKKEETGAAVTGTETETETRREKLYYILNLITEWCEMLKQQPRALLSRDQILIKLKQVKKELEDMKKASPAPAPVPDPQPQVYRWSSHAAALAEIHGFDDKLMIMERLLCRKGCKAVGIVGVAGVGKTALCQRAYNHPPVRDHFPLRIWLCLSNNQKKDTFEDHLKRMLSCLGFGDGVIQKAAGVEKLKLAVRRQLNRGRYLVVLDDVWMVEENGKMMVEKEIQTLFNFLNHDLPRLSGYEGTLLLTSRSPQLEDMVGATNMHRLLPLADDDSCWKIFSDAFKEEDGAFKEEDGAFKEEDGAFKEEDGVKRQPFEDFEKRKNILAKCDGLPLMAKMLGKIAHLQLS